MAARVADFCHTVDHFDACILDEKELEDEGIIFQPSKPVTISCPGEDLWKKFALPPTPPRSPVKSVVEVTQQEKTVAERLQLLSETLDNDVYDNCTPFDTVNWKTKIIQDCMWNGSVMDGMRRGNVCSEDVEDLYPTPCSTPPLLDYSCTECVDPSTVFPGCSFNDCCSCSSFSDSSSSDEEIDVVTVDNPVVVGLKRKSSAIESSTRSRVVPAPLKRARSHPGHVTDAGFHDYTSLVSPIVETPKSTVLTVKAFTRHTISHHNATSSLRRERLRYDDLDPESKRATHNVLERKRRNDLKSSFQSLRSAVPTLKSCEKTPKVTILRKAADHIRLLKLEGDRLVKEKDVLRKKQQEMLKKYVTLTKNKTSLSAKSA